jgi:hypothetical protein
MTDLQSTKAAFYVRSVSNINKPLLVQYSSVHFPKYEY